MNADHVNLYHANGNELVSSNLEHTTINSLNGTPIISSRETFTLIQNPHTTRGGMSLDTNQHVLHSFNGGVFLISNATTAQIRNGYKNSPLFTMNATSNTMHDFNGNQLIISNATSVGYRGFGGTSIIYDDATANYYNNKNGGYTLYSSTDSTIYGAFGRNALIKCMSDSITLYSLISVPYIQSDEYANIILDRNGEIIVQSDTTDTRIRNPFLNYDIIRCDNTHTEFNITDDDTINISTAAGVSGSMNFLVVDSANNKARKITISQLKALLGIS